jgi:hypothetical protein
MGVRIMFNLDKKNIDINLKNENNDMSSVNGMGA